MMQDKIPSIQVPQVDDRPLWDVIFAIYGYPALLLAHRLKVFPLLAENARTLLEICGALNIQQRPAEAILTTATALGFLSLQDGRYCLTPVTEAYLLETSPNYFGFFWDMMIDNYQVSSIAGLEKAVLTDSPQAYGGGDIFKSHEEQIKLLRRFTAGMHSISITSALVWPTIMDFSGHRVMLDIGGGSGAHSIGAALRLPNLQQALLLDFSQVCEVAEEYIAQYGLQTRVKTYAGNIWQDRWPTADLHFFSNMYHDWLPDKCHFLTAKSFGSLESGGRIVIHEMLYNDEKTGPFTSAAYSMIMMGWTEGRQYSGQELTAMLDEIGFEEIQIHKAFGYHSIVTGLKP
ncbi:Dimerisation domain-containing protein [Nitrosomonas cryotolerans]|uniref:Dimerisation domain-containing protein n=1 Tax=Nitrosomonas cryotolerans ATCC 49181 TaxID=1131553 RepID=A0A1N6I2M2_9PROT|nr:methyltransferase [Nitrosomonas cryotolerans]SFP58995.1 Dimerisation domain-containing protein [Nitrosomonas cryotolerans]SIO26253.1 Dimerisation domain-containing protein [Nitrosomonas cryotolerans ATCC 49181]